MTKSAANMSAGIHADPITVIPSGAAVGAEIRGVDLSRPVGPDTFAQIEAALHEHGAVWFRDQKLDDAQQKAFSLLWGDELDIHPLRKFAKPGYPEVFVLSNILDVSGNPVGAVDAAQYWHSDLSYSTHPSRVSILQAIEIPMQDGMPLGETEFASTAAAWDALPADMQHRLLGLKAAHLAQKPKSGGHFVKPLDSDTQSRLQEVVHPLVRTHPFTGRKCLYVNHGFTTHIVGLPPAESDRLLQELFDFIVQPRFMFVHRWAVGNVLVWDNCSTIHQGVGNYKLPQRRLIYRTIVKGGVPF